MRRQDEAQAGRLDSFNPTILSHLQLHSLAKILSHFIKLFPMTTIFVFFAIQLDGSQSPLKKMMSAVSTDEKSLLKSIPPSSSPLRYVLAKLILRQAAPVECVETEQLHWGGWFSRGRSCQYKPPHPIQCPHSHIFLFLILNAPMPQCPNAQSLIHNTQCPKPNAPSPIPNALMPYESCCPDEPHLSRNCQLPTKTQFWMLKEKYAVALIFRNFPQKICAYGWQLILTVAKEAYRGRWGSGQNICWHICPNITNWHICPKYYKRPFFHRPCQGRLCKHHISPWPNQPTQMADQLV